MRSRSRLCAARGIVLRATAMVSLFALVVGLVIAIAPSTRVAHAASSGRHPIPAVVSAPAKRSVFAPRGGPGVRAPVGAPSVPETAPAPPPGSAKPMGFVAGKSVENVAKRTSTGRFFDDPDGSHVAEISLAPMNFRDPAHKGAWTAIDSTLVADPSRPGWWRSNANSWTARFGPTPSIEFDSQGGGVQTMTPIGGAPVAPVVSAASGTVTYPGVWPNVDLRYVVSATGVEEDIVVNGPTGRSSFDFSTGNVSYVRALDGGMAPVGVPVGAAPLSVPVVRARDGSPVENASPALSAVSLADGSDGVRVSVAPTWNPSSYPYVIDPTFAPSSSDMTSYKSDGYSCTGCGLEVGNSLSNGDTYWRAVGYFDCSSIAHDAVVSASIEADDRVYGTANNYPFNVWWASAWSYSGATGLGNLISTSTGNGGTFTSPTFSSSYDAWVAPGSGCGALGFTGYEQPGLNTYKQFDNFVLWVDYYAIPTPPTPSAPANGGAPLHTFTPTLAAGNVNWGQQLAPGTSPSIAALPTGGFEAAFQDSGGSLETVGTAGSQNWSLGMMPGTSPSIAALSSGGYVIAFQSNAGSLWTVGTSTYQNWSLGMMPGTSPAVAGLSSGGFEATFQDNTGSLWTVGNGGDQDWSLGMGSGTSPSIAGLTSGGYEAAFEDNTGSLWTVGNGGDDDWHLGMMGRTSPSITGLGTGGYEVAFEDNQGSLYTMGTAGSENWSMGMSTTTNPSISGWSWGGYEIAFQDNQGQVYTVGSEGNQNWEQIMAAGTSPSVAALAYGGYEVDFQSNTTSLWAVGTQLPDAIGGPYYNYQVSTDPNFNTFVVQSGWVEATSWTVPSGWLGANNLTPKAPVYYWRVEASNGKNDARNNLIVSPWSVVWSFTTNDSPPSSPPLSSPGSSSTQSISTSTTTFTAGASADPDGDTISYRFQVATGADGQTGRLITSGWQSGTTWSPPAGTFQDSGLYYWTAQSQDSLGVDSAWSQPLPFRVDFRMGDDSRLPYDTEGPVSVNLSTGHAVVTAGGPSFQTVGGPVGLSLAYNSMAPQTYGLTGTYYQDPRGVGAVQANSGQTLQMTRQDTSLNFNWGSDAATDGPAPGTVAPDHWVAEWTGYLTTPATGSYELVANRVDDAVTASVGGTNVLSANFTEQLPYVGNTFSGGSDLPITIDYAQVTGPEYLDIQIKDPDGTTYEIPASWLTSNPPVLPDGWSRTGNSFAAGYTALNSVSVSTVAVTDDTGEQHLFTADGSSGWTPPPGEDSTLTKNSDGTWTLLGDDGYTYSFDVTGQLTQVTSPTDDAHPGAPTYNYAPVATGGPSRLMSIVDATGRTMTFQYWGQSGVTCPTGSGYDGYNNAPAGIDTDFLCRVSYADDNTAIPPVVGFGGGETDLYFTNGQLSRITNPGDATAGTPTTDFLYSAVNVTDPASPTGFDSVSMLTGIRDQLTNDLIADGVITDANNSDGSTNLKHFTQIAYMSDGTGRVTSVTLPEPDSNPNTSIPEHSYAYPSGGPSGGTTTVTVAGESTSQGWARRVAYDSAGHATTETGADDIAVNYVWDDLNDRLLATIDHHYAADPTHGLETTNIYDAAGDVTDTYGPAPATTFSSNYTSTTPLHATSTFDGGMPGLAGSWYKNTANPSGPAAFHNTDTLADKWGSGTPSTSNLVTPKAIPTTPFSGVLTGQATLTQPGRLQLTADGAQVWVDDHQVISALGGPYAAAVNADNPAYWWRLADPKGSTSAVDQSGGDPGTYDGYSDGVVTTAGQHSGDNANAATFNGSTQYMNVPTPPGSTDEAGFKWLGLSAFSIDAWIDPTGTPSSQAWERIVDFGTGAATNNVVLDLGPDGNDLNFSVYNNGTAASVQASRVITYGTWQHVAVTFSPNGQSGGTATLFLNGNQVATQTLSVAPNAVTYNNNYIGRSEWSADPYFSGSMQDVAIYQSALSATRIQAHYQAGGQADAANSSCPPETKLLCTPVIWNTPYPKAVVNDTPTSFWRLGDLSGTTVPDDYGSNVGTAANLAVGAAGSGADPNDSGALPATFNGTSSTVSIPDNADLNPSSFSVEAWIKTASTNSTYEAIASKMANASPYTGWEFDVTPSGGLQATVASNTTTGNAIQIATVAGTNVADGKWHQVAVAYTGNESASGVTFYIDGHQIASAAPTDDNLTASFSNTQALTIGSRASSAYFFNGSIQDVSYYTYALAGPSVAAHYTAASAAVPPLSDVHRIRIEVQQFVTGGQLALSLTQGGTLQPRYGLETGHTDPDGRVTEVSYTNTLAGITPSMGIPTSTTVDRTGLSLTASTAYEPLGTGFLRPTAGTLPAGNSSSLSYYSNGSIPTNAANPCVSGSAAVNQGGALYQRVDPGGAITTTYVYDEAGRTLATQTNTDGWACTTYDTRGRSLTQTIPASTSAPGSARTVTYNYAVGNNPAVTSVSDPAGTITATVDWDGRQIAYQDVHGNTTTTTYDQAGRPTSVAGPYGNTAVAYDNADRVQTASFNGTVQATPSYNTAGLESSIAYANGTTAAYGWDTNGRPDSVTYNQAGGSLLFSDNSTIDPAGKTTADAQADPSGTYNYGYGYDNAGRLTTATAPGHSYTYAYSPTGGCGTLTTAGANSDRTSSTDNGVATSYCYNSADQLTSTTATNHGAVAYDTDGNTTTLGADGLTYDGDNRNLGLSSTTSGVTTTVTYQRDATNRVIRYSVVTGGTTTTDVEYGYTSDSQSPVYIKNMLNSTTQNLVALPGGVLETITGATSTWAYPNLHGDDAAQATNTGARTGATTLYDPFGNALTSLPTELATPTAQYGWEGQHQITTDTDSPIALQQMGARVYDPILGRFLQTDPIRGGSCNDYDYACQDPIDGLDLAGTHYVADGSGLSAPASPSNYSSPNQTSDLSGWFEAPPPRSLPSSRSAVVQPSSLTPPANAAFPSVVHVVSARPPALPQLPATTDVVLQHAFLVRPVGEGSNPLVAAPEGYGCYAGGDAGVESGAYAGTAIVPGIGTAIGGGVGWLAGCGLGALAAWIGYHDWP